MKKNKSQTALEYLMIIAITLGIIVPTTYLFFRYSSESTVRIVDSQITQIGRDIIDTAESVYFSGESSKVVIELNMPESVNNMHIVDEKELVFNLTTAIGDTEAVFFSRVNITSSICSDSICSLSDISGIGLKKIKFESFDNGKKVLISKGE